MPTDYGPTPRITEVDMTPKITRTDYIWTRRLLENRLMSRVLSQVGRIAGKQAAMVAYNYGMKDPEKLKYIRNFAQDKARTDALRIMDEMQASPEGFQGVIVNAEQPDKIEREEMLNMGLRQLMKDSI